MEGEAEQGQGGSCSGEELVTALDPLLWPGGRGVQRCPGQGQPAQHLRDVAPLSTASFIFSYPCKNVKVPCLLNKEEFSIFLQQPPTWPPQRLQPFCEARLQPGQGMDPKPWAGASPGRQRKARRHLSLPEDKASLAVLARLYEAIAPGVSRMLLSKRQMLNYVQLLTPFLLYTRNVE